MQIKHFSHGESLAHTSSSQLSVTCPTIFIYTICSSVHQCIIMVDRQYIWWLRTWTMKDSKFCQFTHLSMSPNHCWTSAKLLKLAVSLDIIIPPTLWVYQNKKYYYMNVLCLSLLGAWPKATAHSVSSPLQRGLGISLSVPWAFKIWVRE